MRITEVELSAKERLANQKAREAQRQADLERKRAEAERIHNNRATSVSPSQDAELKGKGPEIGDGRPYYQDFDHDRRQHSIDAQKTYNDATPEMRNRLNALHAEVGGADNVDPNLDPVIDRPKYKPEQFSKTVLNDPNSVLQFDVPGYRAGTVGKPGTIQEKWQQFNTQTTNEKAPPGDKSERMVKDIKKGYTKDGKLTKQEKSIAYATAWKLYNKRKGKKS